MKAIIIVAAIASVVIAAAFADEFDIKGGEIDEDIKATMGNEGLFNLSPETGMSAGPRPAPGPESIDAQRLSMTVNVAGSWALDLLNGSQRTSVDLLLSQAQEGGVIYGRGAISAGNSSQRVAVGGTVDGSKLDLFVIPEDAGSLYRIDLNAGSSFLSGTYRSFGNSLTTGTGRVTGYRSELMEPVVQ